MKFLLFLLTISLIGCTSFIANKNNIPSFDNPNAKIITIEKGSAKNGIRIETGGGRLYDVKVYGYDSSKKEWIEISQYRSDGMVIGFYDDNLVNFSYFAFECQYRKDIEFHLLRSVSEYEMRVFAVSNKIMI
ncbi:hypothetical protein [Moheibacter stercoris]|uniref:Lipoprotein n=1 Tax=Moheibacter stercoris TaxID=1628251 RepID=A0ABV2LR87_9FLAO